MSKYPAGLTLDVSPMLDDQWTGIPIFTARLAKALMRYDLLDVRFCCNLSSIPAEHIRKALRFGTGTFLREEMWHDGDKKYGLIDASIPLLFPSVKHSFGVSAREASTIHDLSTLFMPENHEESNVAHHLDRLREELATDERIFCVSEATRQALLVAFPSAAAKTEVISQYVDWPAEFASMDRNAAPLSLGRYAAVVGTLEPRKNLGLLFKALKHPLLRKTDLNFVVIGRKGWKIDDLLADIDDETARRVIFTGFVSEFTKYRLLRHSDFLILPSIYEGFGIPAVEAMSLGKLVLASFTSSFPEVIGDAGCFFDPFSPEDFVQGLERIDALSRQSGASDTAFRQSESFTWQRMADPVVRWLRS